LEVARRRSKHAEAAHLSRLIATICERLGDLAAGEACLWRAMAPLEATVPPAAVRSLLAPVVLRLAELYMGMQQRSRRPRDATVC
jgi:hypothetical protein